MSILFSLSTVLCIGQSPMRCATDEVFAKDIKRNPELASDLAETDSLIRAVARQGAGGREVFEIPVVVHILYYTESENISYGQVTSQIEVLNQDFNRENPDASQTPEPFAEIATSPGIRFYLADRDPDGNKTTGITRRKVNIENIGSTDRYYKTNQGGADPWFRAHYLNIWVCSTGDSVLGFSTLPGMTLQEKDGIVMVPRAFGTEGTAYPPYNQGRSLTHEVGHYLGLKHLWKNDDDCRTDDGMDDTPPQKEPNYGCPDFPHISCGNTPHGDMFMNYMDYTNDTCMNMFTFQQVALMRAVMKTVRKSFQHSEAYTGIDLLRSGAVDVFPNPVVNQLTISGAQEGQARVYDISGRPIHVPSTKLGNDSLLDFSSVPEGMYLVNLIKAEGVMSWKISVSRR